MKRLCLAAVAALAAAPSAFAHAILDGGPLTAGATAELSIRIGHGCDGAATDAVIVTFPDGVTAAQPMAKPGWTVEAFGDPAAPAGIAWTGGSLPDALYDRFPFRVAVGAAAAGTELAFPVIQRCGETEIAWSEIAAPGVDPHTLQSPAPTVTVAAASPDPASFSAGALTVTEPWARATPPGAGVGGVYAMIANGSGADIRLTGGSTPMATEVEIHSMSVENNVMRMAEVEGGLPIPAGGAVAFEPGGYHIMLQGLVAPLVEGASFPLTLTFSDDTTLTLSVPVRSLTGQPAAPAEHQH
ncbi:MAG: copper chaperone PCu(A)C [Bauldia sp.]|nr:copper chaperone PCu(A)C [Bauldia sp.]